MALFEIMEHTMFENIYLVEADSLEEAQAIVDDDTLAPDFYQKHVSSKQVSWTELVEGSPSEDDIEIAAANVNARGYI